MRFSKFKIDLDRNKEITSKNGVIPNKKNKVARLSGVIASIDVDKISENPEQARSYFKGKEFEVLKQSIKREGLLHPIIVYRDKDSSRYVLKAGHRRLRAITELGYTQVDCAVFTDKTEATFAAISTNEFAESIHPIDKGVEVESLIAEFKDSNIPVSLQDIADFYGVSTSTIKEWKAYAKIDKSIRAEIIKKDVRSKDFLRKAIKICKEINNMDYSEEERVSQINERFHLLINNSGEKVKKVEKKVSLLDGPAIRNFLYYDRVCDEFKIRDVVGELSRKDKNRLKKKVIELLDSL